MLGRAFQHDPAAACLIPDARRRAVVLPELWRGALRYTLRYGEAWGVASGAGGLSGVACWLPPGQGHKTMARMLRAGMWRLFFTLRPAELAANLRNDRYGHELHARCAPAPHWYLFVIGVEPDCHGQGVGSTLLRPVLARCDAAGHVVYLETHNPRNVGFYEPWGFEVAEKGRMPGSDVPVWEMVRRPKACAAARLSGASDSQPATRVVE